MKSNEAKHRSGEMPGDNQNQKAPQLDLTEFQARLAELAGDLIGNGGDEKDVKLMLEALLRHEYRRQVPHWTKTDLAGAKRPNPAEHAARWIAEWYRDLAKGWPPRAEAGQTTKEPQEPMPTTVADMLRANARGVLSHEFDNFLRKAEMEEVYLMNALLVDWGNSAAELGDALDANLQRSEAYIKVPKSAKRKVEMLLEILAEEAA